MPIPDPDETHPSTAGPVLARVRIHRRRHARPMGGERQPDPQEAACTVRLPAPASQQAPPRPPGLESVGTQGIVTSQMDLARRLGLAAKVEGISPESYFQTLDKNKHTNAALLSCYCQHKMVNEAVSLFQMMKHELGLPSHSVIYNNMINLHWKLGQHKILTELFEVMKEEGCASDGYPFTLVLQSYAAVGDIHGAEQVEDAKRAAKKGVLRWRYCTALAASHVAASNYDRACSIFAELEQTIKRVQQKRAQSYHHFVCQHGQFRRGLSAVENSEIKVSKDDGRDYLNLLQILARL